MGFQFLASNDGEQNVQQDLLIGQTGGKSHQEPWDERRGLRDSCWRGGSLQTPPSPCYPCHPDDTKISDDKERPLYWRFLALHISVGLWSCLPDVCISLSVQASQTYLLPTHSLPLLLGCGIWRIHGAGRSYETNINITISCVSGWGHIPKSRTIS